MNRWRVGTGEGHISTFSNAVCGLMTSLKATYRLQVNLVQITFLLISDFYCWLSTLMTHQTGCSSDDVGVEASPCMASRVRPDIIATDSSDMTSQWGSTSVFSCFLLLLSAPWRHSSAPAMAPHRGALGHGQSKHICAFGAVHTEMQRACRRWIQSGLQKTDLMWFVIVQTTRAIWFQSEWANNLSCVGSLNAAHCEAITVLSALFSSALGGATMVCWGRYYFVRKQVGVSGRRHPVVRFGLNQGQFGCFARLDRKQTSMI